MHAQHAYMHVYIYTQISSCNRAECNTNRMNIIEQFIISDGGLFVEVCFSGSVLGV